MSPSKIVGLVWVLFVGAWARGWAPTHTWLPNWIAILAVVYVVLVVIEWLRGEPIDWRLPRRTRPVRPVAPAE